MDGTRLLHRQDVDGYTLRISVVKECGPGYWAGRGKGAAEWFGS